MLAVEILPGPLALMGKEVEDQLCLVVLFELKGVVGE